MRGVLITWGTPIPGRERMALEEFASYQQWTLALQKEGKIARHEVYAPVFGSYESFSGFSIIEGTDKQIQALADSDEFRARTQRTMSTVQGVRVELLEVGDNMTKVMMTYAQALQQLKL